MSKWASLNVMNDRNGDRIAAMSNPDDLEARVSKVEAQVEIARADAAAARVLASGADREVTEVRAELRAHTRTLNALRETQIEQGKELVALRQDMGVLRQDMQRGFGMVNTGMAQITVLLKEISESEKD